MTGPRTSPASPMGQSIISSRSEVIDDPGAESPVGVAVKIVSFGSAAMQWAAVIAENARTSVRRVRGHRRSQCRRRKRSLPTSGVKLCFVLVTYLTFPVAVDVVESFACCGLDKHPSHEGRPELWKINLVRMNRAGRVSTCQPSSRTRIHGSQFEPPVGGSHSLRYPRMWIELACPSMNVALNVQSLPCHPRTVPENPPPMKSQAGVISGAACQANRPLFS